MLAKQDIRVTGRVRKVSISLSENIIIDDISTTQKLHKIFYLSKHSSRWRKNAHLAIYDVSIPT